MQNICSFNKTKDGSMKTKLKTNKMKEKYNQLEHNLKTNCDTF